MIRRLVVVAVMVTFGAGCVFDAGSPPSASWVLVDDDVSTTRDADRVGADADAGPSPTDAILDVSQDVSALADMVGPDAAAVDGQSVDGASPDAAPGDATSDSADGSQSDALSVDAGGDVSSPDASSPDDALAPPPLAPGVWPVTFTTTVSGGGLTLRPLGARRGFSGTLSASDGSLTLKALP